MLQMYKIDILYINYLCDQRNFNFVLEKIASTQPLTGNNPESWDSCAKFHLEERDQTGNCVPIRRRINHPLATVHSVDQCTQKTTQSHLQFAMLLNRILGCLVDRVVDFHNGGLIAAAITIIGCRKDRDDRPVVLPLVSFHDELVRPRNKVQAVNVRKLLRNVLPKRVTSSPR